MSEHPSSPRPADQPYDPELDALLSYDAAVRAIGERVRQGEPVPEFMRSRRNAE